MLYSHTHNQKAVFSLQERNNFDLTVHANDISRDTKTFKKILHSKEIDIL